MQFILRLLIALGLFFLALGGGGLTEPSATRDLPIAFGFTCVGVLMVAGLVEVRKG